MRTYLKVIAATTVASMTLLAAPAFAGPAEQIENDWGTVVPGVDQQADAWIVKVEGFNHTVDTALFEAHYPGTPNAPHSRAGGAELVDLRLPSVSPFAPKLGIGVGSGLFAIALANKLPGGSQGSPDVPTPGAAYASAGGGKIDIGIPYIPDPRPAQRGERYQLSPFGFHIDGITVEATTGPGDAGVNFSGRFGRAYISSFGKKIIDIPAEWPPNFGVRIPQDHRQPVIAQAVLNEQVTTDTQGRPSVDDKFNYVFDQKSGSGYINAGHATVLGPNAADVTIGHAAVIRSDSGPTDLPDVDMPELPKLPGIPDLPGIPGLD